MFVVFYNIKVSFGKVILRFFNVVNWIVGMFDLVWLVILRIFMFVVCFVGFWFFVSKSKKIVYMCICYFLICKIYF